MNDIKYTFKYKGNEFYLIENIDFDNDMIYPLFKAKTHTKVFDMEFLDYPLSALKIPKENKEKILKIKEKWLSKNSSHNIKEYTHNEYTYLIFLDNNLEIKNKENLAIFPNGLREFCDLGCLYLDKVLTDEIFELDQNLQSCISIELMLELLEENEDMNKYIDFIKSNIKDEHLEQCFFFDAYIYELFSKKYIEVLNDFAVFKDDEIGRKEMINFFVNSGDKNE